MHSQHQLHKPTIVRQLPVHGIRSALGRCTAATPDGTLDGNPTFKACYNGTAMKNDGKTPIGKAVAKFQVPFPGAGVVPGTVRGGIVGVCCADYTDLKKTIADVRDVVQPFACNIDAVKNLIPEKFTFPFDVGQKVPIAFPVRKYICPPPGEPEFVPPQTPAELPPR